MRFVRGFYFSPLSSHSDVASGMSDGNEGGTSGRHEGRSAKRHQRRSVRSRSRHDKTTKAKLNVLNVRPRHCSVSCIKYCLFCFFYLDLTALLTFVF